MANPILEFVVEMQNKAEKEILKLNKQIESVNEQSVKIAQANKEIERTSPFKNLNKTIDDTIVKIGKVAVGFFAFEKIGSLIKESTRLFLDFDDQMRRVNTITRLNSEELGKMSEQILQMSKQAPFSARELSNAMFDIASAGIEAENQLAFLAQSAKFATAGTTDLNTSVEGLTAVIKGWGMETTEAIKVSDLFFKANELGQTTVAEMASSIQSVTAQAKTYGLSLEELFGVYATFTGVTGDANAVTTQLSGALNSLAAPTAEASARFKEMGIEVGAAAIKKKGLAVVAKEVFDAVGGDVEQLRKLIPEITGARLVTALATEQFDDFNKKVLLLNSSVGSTQIAFEEMEQSVAVKLKKAESSFEMAKIKFGQTTAGFQLLATEFVLEMSKVLQLATNIIGNGVKAMFFSVVQGALDLGTVVEKFLNRTIRSINSLFEGIGIDKRISEITSISDFTSKKSQELDQQISNSFQSMKQSFKLNVTASDELTANFVSQNEQANILANGLAKATNETNKLAKSSGSLSKEIEKASTDSIKFLGDTAKDLDSLSNKIEVLQEKMTGLTKGFLAEEKTDREKLAQSIVASEEKIADIRKQIAEKNKQLTETDQSEKKTQLDKDILDLQNSLNQEVLTREQHKNIISQFESEITEVKRFNGLTQLEQAIENYNQERARAIQAFTDKKAELEKELQAVEAQKQKILKTITDHEKEIIELQKRTTNEFKMQLDQQTRAVEASVAQMIDLYQRLARARTDAGGIMLNSQSFGQTPQAGSRNTSINITVNGDVSGNDLIEKVGDALVKKLQLSSAAV